MADFDRELDWVRRHMPKLQRAIDRLPELSGMRLACNMHLDIKMAPFVEGLLSRGASVYLTTCNPQTVRDPVVSYLTERGAQAQAWHGMDKKAYDAAILDALAWEPTHICDMGAELSAAYAGRQSSASRQSNASRQRHPGREGPASRHATGIQAGLEATGSGIARLEGLELGYPVYNWDDLPVKEGLHNRRMVGLTAWHVFFERTGLTLHDMRVLVVGFGSVGRGVAESARAYGGTVVVCEREPGRALEASFAGWATGTLDEELPRADVVITATGARNIINEEHIDALKPGVFLLNVGHVAHEIDVTMLERYPKEPLFPHVDEYRLPDGTGLDKRVYLLAGGSMINLTAGRGDSINAFDVTLAVLVGGVGYIAREGARRSPGLYLLPEAAWRPFVAPGA